MATQKEMADALALTRGNEKTIDPVKVAEVVTDIDMDPTRGEGAETVEPVAQPPRAKGDRWNRATFILDPLLVAQIRTVAGVEQTTYNNIVERALTSYLKTWQLAHPYIDLSKIKLNPKK